MTVARECGGKSTPSRLLLLNWRDPWHPQAGGAELLTLRVVEELTKAGWSVEWFSAAYPGAPSDSFVNGMHFVRAGCQTTVHFAAYQRYKRTNAFDIVIDEINTIPFYTPLYFKCRTFAWINQLAADVWRYESPKLLGMMGKVLEPIYLSPYRRTEIITISDSSANSLRQIGFQGKIHIIPMAVDELADEYKPRKTEPPDILVVGRLTPSKRLEHALMAAADLKRMGWRGNLHIVGGGKERYAARLRSIGMKLLGSTAVFHGRVSMRKREQLLKACTVLWMTSVHEGWGLVVTEAARHWTPAVAYNVPGLRDSIIEGSTGKLVPERPEALAMATYDMFATNVEHYAKDAMLHSRSLSWEKTGEVVRLLLQKDARKEYANVEMDPLLASKHGE